MGSRSGQILNNRLRQPPWDGYFTKGFIALTVVKICPSFFGPGVPRGFRRFGRPNRARDA